jgi:hypothetical protein
VYLQTAGVREGPLPWVLKCALGLVAARDHAALSTPVPAFATVLGPTLLGRFGSGRSYDIGADNSNVTSAVHALRARFFSPHESCASVDKPEPVTVSYVRLGATGKRTVLALERPLGVGEHLECLVERLVVVRRHHAGPQERARRRDRRVEGDVDVQAAVIQRLP